MFSNSAPPKQFQALPQSIKMPKSLFLTPNTDLFANFSYCAVKLFITPNSNITIYHQDIKNPTKISF